MAAVSDKLASAVPEQLLVSRDIWMEKDVPSAKLRISQSASSLSAFSLGGFHFENCTVNFVAYPSSTPQLHGWDLDEFTDF